MWIVRVYVVTCCVKGCDECTDVHHIVGVYSNYALAEEAVIEHRTKNTYDNIRFGLADHLHIPDSIDIDEMEVIQ